MSPRIYRGRTAARFCLGLAALSCLFVGIVAADAQAPVITNPGDVRSLGVNTALSPGNPDPAWAEMAPMPTARAGFAAAAANGKVYVIGGAVLNDCVTTQIVEAYDPVNDFWITESPIPDPSRYRSTAATLDGIIYVVGGAMTVTICNDTVLGTVQAYDPVTGKWSDEDKASLNMPRVGVGLGVDALNHLLYAVGGATGSPNNYALGTVEVYDPATNSWTTKQHLDTPRTAPAVAAVNGKIYAIGGQAQNDVAIDTVEVYDPAKDSWTTQHSRMPHPRLNSAAAIVDDKIYVMGGGNEGLISTVDVYDPAFDKWTMGDSLPTARRLLGAGVVENTIYAIGGNALVARVGEQFIYQITATNNPTSYNTSRLPLGLYVDRNRGIIFGTPADATQAFLVTLKATNSAGSGFKDISFYIAESPSEPESIVSTTCATGRADQPFNFQVLTNNVDSNTKLTATGLPYQPGVGGGPQLTIDPGTGHISGIVSSMVDTSSQSFGVELGLTNVDAAQSYLQFTFVSDPDFPVITSGSNAALIPNEFFSYTITADAATASLDYLGLDGKTLDGPLPPGLSFDSATGKISGLYTGDVPPESCNRNGSAGHGANGDSFAGEMKSIETIKKEPPPRIQLFAQGLDQDGIGSAGTGTAPLNFFIGLHDFEAESLKPDLSKGTDYVIFTDDPLMSGGAAGLLEATKVGDYVSYTVPIQARGTYDVKVGIRTGADQGTFQLAIDGANQGPVQDEYSAAVGYEVRDLGPVTFSDDKVKTLKFSITGQNPISSGYEFICDYVDLVPYFEAEELPVEAHSAPLVTIDDPNLSGGAATLLKATRVGDYVTYAVTVNKAGIYDIRVKANTGKNTGMFQLSIDGVNQGYVQKQEAGISGGGYSLRDLGSVTFSSPGKKAFQFLVTGRNPGGTKYNLVFDYLDLVLTSHREAEKLSADSTTELELVNDTNLSGQAGILLKADSSGEFVTYKVTVPSSGTYDVKVGIRKGNQNGIVQLAIDGVNQGSVLDNYSSEDDYVVADLGKITFTYAGERTFQFLVTGQNPDSEGYQFLLDYIDLVR